MKTIINWKTFFILWIAAVLASIAILPYALELQSSTLASVDLPIPLPVLLVIQTVQNAILFGIMMDQKATTPPKKPPTTAIAPEIIKSVAPS
jgi:hypothetical protein